MSVIDELVRLCQGRELAPLIDCLEGRPSVYDRDGVWRARDWRLLCDTAGAFSGDDLLNAVLAIPFLSSRLPVGDPLRAGLVSLDRRVTERLRNPELLLQGGAPTLTQRDEDATAAADGAWVVVMSSLSFRPARVKTDEQRVFLARAAQRHFPNELWPWNSLYPALEVFLSPGYRAVVERLGSTLVPAGRFELDPRVSAPDLVDAAARRLSVPTDSARLFLQLLTLVDCSDATLGEANGWTKAQLKQHGAPLVTAGLLSAEKQPRSTRTFSLPGAWDAFKPPHPAMERSKLALYDSSCDGKNVVAPLGRVLPLEPLHDLFSKAWLRWLADAETAQPRTRRREDWLEAIRARPEDDLPREVYADWLEEQGDPRGRFIRVQCELARAPTKDRADEARALLEANEARWNERIHAFFEHADWERGFIKTIHAHAGRFARGADTVFQEQPLLDGFVFSETISPLQVRELAACPSFSRFRALDTGGTNYFSRLELLEQLLDSPHFPPLRSLRLAFHRPGRGLGPALAKALVRQTRLHDSLQFLELQGQGLGASMDEDFRVSRHGIEALEVLLAAFGRLETLRVPFNGFIDRDARELSRHLARGHLAPHLRVLDFSNTIAESFVTKVVLEQANTVTREGQHAIDLVLAERNGAVAPPAPAPSVPLPASAVPQTGRHPFAEHAKSGRSKCVVCTRPIEAGAIRIGVERRLPDVGLITAWVHASCRHQCPELAALPDLEARLGRNSSGAWPPKA